MKRTTALLCGLVVVVCLFAPVQPAEAGCGGPWELACWRWNWCLFKVLGICVPGLELVPPDGCDPRHNNVLGLCTPCGSAFEPICIGEGWANLCDNDRRYTPAALCVPCGRSGEPICLSSPVCDPYNRIVYGICSYSGHSAEPTCNCDVGTVPQQPAGEPLRGFADVHVHQFSNLGIGGALFWGDTHHKDGIDKALPWCDWTWKFPILPGLSLWPDFHPTLGFKAHGTVAHQWVDCPIDDFGISVSCNSYEGVHAVSGTGPFEGWPKWSTTTHQQMYYKWLERAYKGGLRLMVQLAVNNQLGCLISGKRWVECADMPNIDRQIDGAYSLEAFIDAQHGGQGKGWYRIVTSPAEARQVIEDGKLAVVLGIETDSLFGCKPLSGCSDAHIEEEVKKYYCKGVRHVFPVHLYDNKFAGSALYNDFWTIANFMVTAGFMDPWDCSDFPKYPEGVTGKKYNYQTTWVQWMLYFYKYAYSWNPLLPNWGPIGAHCNQSGLSNEGLFLVQELMDYGMIIDTDHLSLLALDDVLWLSELRNYPLVAGHMFLFDHPPMEFGHNKRTELHRTPKQIQRMRDIGGLIAPLNPHGKCSSTLDYSHKYKYIVEQMSGGPFYEEDGFPRIAFSTDFGGFFQQTAPRTPRDGGDYCSDSTYENQKYDPTDTLSIYQHKDAEGNTILKRPDHDSYPLLQYPFNAVGGFGTFWKQQTGDRVFDFNKDGLAHVGLLPDFLADLRNFGLTNADLEPMMYSAEAYIRMWEQVDISSGEAVPRVVAEIDGEEGDGEWYVSDVVVSWNDHCDAETVDYDTTGTDVDCTVESPCGPVTTTVLIMRDVTPPTVTDSQIVNTTPPSDGWFKEIVQVAFEAEDLTSGLFGGSPITVSVTAEGEDLTASHTFRDQAGNTVLAELGGINIDMTPPLIGFRFEHAPDLTPEEFEAEVQAWHNFDVVFEVFATDELSGVDSVLPERLVVSAEGISVAGTATATDVAGNSSTATSPAVKIDKTPPVITYVGRVPEQPNEHGWYNSQVTLTWSCSDALSGVVEEVVTQTLSTDGTNQSLTGRCTDQAGNFAEDTMTGLNLDMTPPLLACAPDPSELWPANHKMTPVAIAIDFTDATSGTDSFWLTAVTSNEPDTGLKGDEPNDIQGFVVTTDDTDGELRAERFGGGSGRIYTIEYACQDLAGNQTSCSCAVTVPHDQGKGSDKN